MEWIVIANRVDAKIYKYINSRFSIVKEFDNPMGRLKDKELQYDEPGQSRAKYIGSAPHSLDGEKSPHQDVADQFANTLAKSLQSNLKQDPSLKLKVVAEPWFLGRLRSHFAEKLVGSRVEWINKDLKKIPQDKWSDIIGL